MTTQPLKQILEQANLPWSEKLNDEWLFLDKDGLRIARADSIYHDDRTLILHSVNNLSRAIEALKRAEKALEVSRRFLPTHGTFAEEMISYHEATQKLLENELVHLQTVQTP